MPHDQACLPQGGRWTWPVDLYTRLYVVLLLEAFLWEQMAGPLIALQYRPAANAARLERLQGQSKLAVNLNPETE